MMDALLELEKTMLGIFLGIMIAIFISKLRHKQFKLPPGPTPVPIFGNWLQVGNDLNHGNLVDLAKRFGHLFLLRMGVRNLVVVSSPQLAKQVLHTQGVVFGSRCSNMVYDIFTAIDTTLRSIEWAIAELINHPEVQKKLRHEIDSVLGVGVQVTEPDTHKLPYLEAVIKETLRLRMGVPLLVPHMNLDDAKLGGYDIPAKSKVVVNAWWLANNPAHWKNPEEFRPERFMEEESNVEANGNDFRFLPFGAGRRSCPGIMTALPIMGITLGRLVQNFELLPPPGQSKIDTAEKRGQFLLQILKHSTVVAKPRSI
uniref:Cinammate 4-hydroxylase 2 n=1 Tax=Daucus carota TaxID=4039 RepID=A0A097HUW8_DAUCA|nr:cinammate 4-hydroxylase 2 [Daucus carota]